MQAELAAYKDVFLVYDSAIEAAAFKVRDASSRIRGVFAVDAGNKTMDQVLEICRFLASAGADRDALLLAMGGGTTSDIAGFAAAIYKRGIKVAFAPTTLLAMADAAYGGKNGVNLDGIKNALGTFLMPEHVWPQTESLKTLPEREILSGGAEILKTFLLCDGNLYRRAVDALEARDIEELAALAGEAAQIKMRIVGRDPLDRGERRLLNLGHTFGHALEWFAPGRYTHGEAVAAGILKAARISEERGIAEKGLAETLKADFARCGLPTEFPVPEEELQAAIGQDKKKSEGQVHLVLLKRIGEAVII